MCAPTTATQEKKRTFTGFLMLLWQQERDREHELSVQTNQECLLRHIDSWMSSTSLNRDETLFIKIKILHVSSESKLLVWVKQSWYLRDLSVSEAYQELYWT